VDARILMLGEVEGDRVEHVKGITYPVSGFLGASLESLKSSPDNRLYHCVLYLAPGIRQFLSAPFCSPSTCLRIVSEHLVRDDDTQATTIESIRRWIGR
jgi:hypothetical protein